MPFFFTYNLTRFATRQSHLYEFHDLLFEKPTPSVYPDANAHGVHRMKILARICAILLFVVFFAFALKNTHEAPLYMLGYALHGPMILILLAFFIAGTSLGILAMIPSLLRTRRELSRQRSAIDDMRKQEQAVRESRAQPQPDSAVPL
jgi:uncharacterized integral membrane protein